MLNIDTIILITFEVAIEVIPQTILCFLGGNNQIDVVYPFFIIKMTYPPKFKRVFLLFKLFYYLSLHDGKENI